MIYLLSNSIRVTSYQKIIKIDKNELIFSMNKKMITIVGNDFVMEYFDFDEFKVKGKITNLKIDENIT